MTEAVWLTFYWLTFFGPPCTICRIDGRRGGGVHSREEVKVARFHTSGDEPIII